MGLKKKQRTAEWHQNQVYQEVASRVDTTLEKIKEQLELEEKMKETVQVEDMEEGI